MSKRLLNKVAVITGSSSGLGRAIATLYSQEGAKVVCSDLAPSARALVPTEAETNTHELLQKSGGEAVFVKTDVSQAKDMEALIQAAVDKFGRLDM